MRCAECGSDSLRPSERRITIDRGHVYDMPVPAVQCDVCGRMFADEAARARALQVRDTPTEPPADERAVTVPK